VSFGAWRPLVNELDCFTVFQTCTRLLRVYICVSKSLVIKCNNHNAQLARFVQISSILVDSLSNCPVVQLPIVDIRTIGHLRKHRQGDVFSIRW